MTAPGLGVGEREQHGEQGGERAAVMTAAQAPSLPLEGLLREP